MSEDAPQRAVPIDTLLQTLRRYPGVLALWVVDATGGVLLRSGGQSGTRTGVLSASVVALCGELSEGLDSGSCRSVHVATQGGHLLMQQCQDGTTFMVQASLTADVSMLALDLARGVRALSQPSDDENRDDATPLIKPRV